MHKRFGVILAAVAMVILPVLLALSPVLVKDAHAATLQIIMEDGWGSNDVTAGYNPLVSDTGYWGSYRKLNFTVKVDGVTGKAINVTADIPGAVTITKTSAGFDLVTNDNPSVNMRDIHITVKVLDPALEYTFFIQQEATGFGTGCPYSACLVENGNYIPADGYGSPVYTFSSAGNSKTYGKAGDGNFELYNDPSSPCGISITSQTATSITITATKNTSNDDCMAGLGVGGMPPLYMFTQPRYFDDNGNATPTQPVDPNNPGGENGSNGAVNSDCQAGKMGWALCPIMKGLDDALGDLYGFIEQNFLQMEVNFYKITIPPEEFVDGACPGTLGADGVCRSATYLFWQNFRNIANVIFVIISLIIILSQVTSLGINNYGIKKMLLEIIMAALLINLSFFICQAMVDVSNIVGVSVRDFLASIVPGSAFEYIENIEGTRSFLNVIAGLAEVAAVGFSVATILSQGVFGLIAAILVILLVALVAIFMMFVILIVRQIGVILLIVLAPLAFAARILPNTSNLFKKWWSAFVLLLVVYPMCSLVIGLGAAAAAIIGSRAGNASADPVASLASIFTAITSGNWSHLAAIDLVQGVWIAAAVLATVAPYFAVIALSKGALNGLGKLGGMITGKVAGAGAGISKLGRTGASMAQKKYDQTAGRQTAINARALKNKEKVAKAMADNRGVLNKLSGGRIATPRKSAADRMFEDEFNAERTKDEMAMVNLGEYGKVAGEPGYDKNLAKQSRANAIRLGNYKTGNAAYEADLAKVKAGNMKAALMGTYASRSDTNAANIAADPNGSEAALQAQAKTAVLQQESKQSKQLDEQFDAQITDGHTAEVVASTHNGAGVYDALRSERAINAMLQKGDIEGATKLTQAYTASAGYKEDRHAQQRLANVLKTGGTKKSAAHLHALGHQIQSTLKKANTSASYGLDDFAKGTAQETDLTTHATAAVGDNLNSALQNNYGQAEIASQDKDTFKYLAGSGANFSDSQYANVLTSGKTTKELNALLPNIDDSTHLADAAAARAAGDAAAETAANTRAANAVTRRNAMVAAIKTDNFRNINEASFDTLSKAYGGNDNALVAALAPQLASYATKSVDEKVKFQESLDPKVKARMTAAGFVF